MPLPNSTLRWAKRTRESLVSSIETDDLEIHSSREEGGSSALNKKQRIAEALYFGLRYAYGFEECLQTGNWSPWPEECKKINCYGQAIANYAVAKELNLSPKLVEFVGLQREGESMRAGHGTLIVETGDESSPQPWIIDQSLGMYGPVTIEKDIMIVEDLSAKMERTIKRDYKIRKYGFIQNIVQEEEEVANHMHLLKADPEKVLYGGQRIGIPFADSWQSEEPLESPWYLRFLPDRTRDSKGELVSHVILERPGIRSRGLEYKFTLEKDGEVREERLRGYYCEGMIWADFKSPFLIVDVSLESASLFFKLMRKTPLKDRAKFEVELMRESYSSEKEYPEISEAAKETFDRLRDSPHGGTALAVSAAEALYQHAKEGRDSYLSTAERNSSIREIRGAHPLLDFHAKVLERLERLPPGKRNVKREPLNPILQKIKRFGFLLNPNQREDPRLEAFLALETEEEKLVHIHEHRPLYFDDAVDRLIFYRRKIQGRENEIFNLAKQAFDSKSDEMIFGGYVRIFAEFMGHFAVTQRYLCLEDYKKKIVNKLTSNQMLV